MSRFVSVKVVSRLSAIMWTAQHLGVPKGFRGLHDYMGYVEDLMDTGEYDEEYIVDLDTREPVAYFAWCVSNDIHHKGDIFDVASMVIDPDNDSKALRRHLSVRFKELALLNDCKWVSRCKHEGETMRVYFKEV